MRWRKGPRAAAAGDGPGLSCPPPEHRAPLGAAGPFPPPPGSRCDVHKEMGPVKRTHLSRLEALEAHHLFKVPF